MCQGWKIEGKEARRPRERATTGGRPERRAAAVPVPRPPNGEDTLEKKEKAAAEEDSRSVTTELTTKLQMQATEKSLTIRAAPKFRKISKLLAVTAPAPRPSLLPSPPPPKFRKISKLLAVTAPRPLPPRRNKKGAASRSRAWFQRRARKDRGGGARSLFHGDDVATPKKKRKTAASELLVGDARDNVDYPEAAEPDGVAGGGGDMNCHFALKGSARRSFFDNGAGDSIDYSVPIYEIDDGEDYMRFLNLDQYDHAEAEAEAERQGPEAEMAEIAGGLHEADDDSMPTVLPWMTTGEFDDGGFDFDPFLNYLLQDDYDACG